MIDKYCVIGNPIAHSKSPEIHPVYAAQTGQELVYERCLAPLDGFEATIRRLVAEGYRGANVTLPFKLEAARICTRLEERAQAAGAVNTLVFEGGEIIGDNTDGPGLVADITRNAGVSIKDKRVLLLGAGGAARGALLPFLKEGPREIVIANRTVATAAALARDFGGYGIPVSGIGFSEIAGSFDIVVNATASSLAGDLPPVPASVFRPDTLALDMMYGNQATVFMDFAAGQGASVRDGLGMLVEQAAEAFAIWRGVRPATADLLKTMRP
ncbi:shikimate dehydrogenase [Massilia yuzhufengensis]|uniref:Shikimate dehydrogenase (NADP(+)) n=1 Tax=Massilia yuzhufengensis TaxID=1164594 RepID=A0A1I1U2F9_9BURK|nr:shikimate dehydrogenase [Massilia yuzhufengensis]SFD65012.1 shikimate dehydrogenase [Massilia yuzhufengensis]